MIRKAVARVPEGENITHLNIMPMMDMMTILLVAFIFQLSTNALDVIAGTVNLPRTETDAPLPAEVVDARDHADRRSSSRASRSSRSRTAMSIPPKKRAARSASRSRG